MKKQIIFWAVIFSIFAIAVTLDYNVQKLQIVSSIIKINNKSIQELNESLDIIDNRLTNLQIESDQLKSFSNHLGDIINKNADIINKNSTITKNKMDALFTMINATDEILFEEIKKPSYEELKNMTVFISATDLKNGSGWVGTGVIVKLFANGTYILTNNHVSDGCENKMSCDVIDNDKFYRISVIKRSEKYDMALVKIDAVLDGKKEVNGLSIVNPQDKVFVVGHNLGRPFFYSEGTVSGYYQNDLVVGMPIGPGNSGSGVINQNGQLVGLIWAGNIIGEYPYQSFDTTHGLCIPGEAIAEFLKGIVE